MRPLHSLACACLIAAALPAFAQTARTWNFTVLLDGKPVGTHRFEVRGGEGAAPLTVSSDAGFSVKLLGLQLYRYRHRAQERWQGGCLETLDADTDDNGQATAVRYRAEGASAVVDATGRTPSRIDGCAMTFAYWNPAIAQRHQLLDPGTGKYEAVTLQALAATPIAVRGRSVAARGLRIAGLPHPIDVWYDGDEWIALDATLAGGRHLSYRLE